MYKPTYFTTYQFLLGKLIGRSARIRAVWEDLYTTRERDLAMFRKLLCLWVWIILAVPVWGGIVAPEKSEVGKLIPISCTDEADIFIWGIPEGIDYRAIDNNRELICTGLEGVYKFQLTIIKMDWEQKKFTQLTLPAKLILIGKVGPPQPPPPPPTPEPALTGLAKEVYAWGKSVEKYRKYGKDLSENYKTVSIKYAGMTVTIEQAMVQLRELNNKVLDAREKKDDWAIFGSRLEEKLTTAWPMDKPTFVKFLNDVSLGLSYIK